MVSDFEVQQKFDVVVALNACMEVFAKHGFCFSVAESDGRHVVLIDGLEEDLNISLIKALELHCMAFKELDKLEQDNG